MFLLKQKVEEYTYTNISESYPDWMAGTSYVIGDVVRDSNWYWKSAVANSDAVRPSLNLTKWVKIRPSNRYAMLDTASLTFSDNQNNTSGDPTEGIIVEFDNPRYDTITLGYVLGGSIKIELSEDDFATISWEWNWTANAGEGEGATADWYSYYYGLFAEGGDYHSHYIPIPTKSGKIRVTIMPSGTDAGLAKCGYMVCGNNIYTGCTLDAVSLGFNDYSIKSNDEFGTTVLKNRQAQQTMDVTTEIESDALMTMQKKVRDLLGCSIVAIGDPYGSKFQHLIILCYIESFSATASSTDKNYADFTLIETIF